MIDLTHKWCTYRSEHGSGFFYQGKGLTEKVSKGQYRGSGVRFKLASQNHPEFAENTWVTWIIDTYATEAEAFAAEELLVPIESLSNPFCLNMQAGGLKGRGRDAGALYRSINSKKRAESRKAKAQKTKDKIAELKKQLKDKK